MCDKTYEEQIAVWEKEYEKVVAIRREKVAEKIAAEKKELTKRVDEDFAKITLELNQKIKAAEEKIKDATNALNGLGFFAFRAKSERKKVVEQESKEIEILTNKLAAAERLHSQKKDKINQDLEEKENAYYEEMRVKYPMPTKPYPPYKEPINKDRTKMLRSELQKEIIKDAILGIMKSEKDKLYTIKDIANELVYWCEDEELEFAKNKRFIPEEDRFEYDGLNIVLISHLMALLIKENKIERVQDDKIGCFRAL